MSASLVQVQLRSADRRLTCWVEKRSEVKVGNSLTLQEKPGRWWDIVAVGSVAVGKPALDRQRTWDNNI